ncbi:hypothetical protein M752DRAFT_327558 [Aspergillus phoenicis ATCC 13157]|uniref:Wax synthase domain-containing protein n=1 Tax=Aspergillus phoenicis ATCC 13157 TaxID=1353007 RepID=A0A370PH23_ASPPH|nr:hypothetical protein M752DRAFT_327558 [Aspergillus phoenicis ATCC 13157]
MRTPIVPETIMAGYYQPVSRLFFIGTTQTLIPPIVTIVTPKGSHLRYLTILFMIWIFTLMLYPVEKQPYITTLSACAGGFGIITALDILLLNPKQAADFMSGSTTSNNRTTNKITRFISIFRAALEYQINARKINTPREAKNTPSLPRYYAQGNGSKSISRDRFLVRETAIAAWQYLVLDIATMPAVKMALSKQQQEQDVSAQVHKPSPIEQLIEQVIVAIVAWLIISRILMSFYYRMIAVISVALRLESPERYPPLFNKMADAYTLRNFWGKFWHQILRVTFTAVSNFITRDILGLAKSSLLERYTNVFCVFFLSGVLHLTMDVIVLDCTVRESGSMVFFLSFVLGYMVEDGVQAVWRKLQGSQDAGSSGKEPEVWKKALGYVWVSTFLTVMSAVYFEPVRKRPERQTYVYDIMRSMERGMISSLELWDKSEDIGCSLQDL